MFVVPLNREAIKTLLLELKSTVQDNVISSTDAVDTGVIEVVQICDPELAPDCGGTVVGSYNTEVEPEIAGTTPLYEFII
jgi:hypothetical protein